MNKTNNIAYLAGLVITLSVGLWTQPAQVDAQGLPLQVAPARQEIALDPGESSAVVVRFMNLSDFAVSGTVRVADFIVDNPQGTPHILESTEQLSPRFSGASWVSIPFDRMSVASNDRVSVQATITVPQDARPGGRYVAVYFEPAGATPQSVNAPQEAGAAVQQRIAALMYIRVNGPITEKALVSRIYAPTFLEYGPISVEADVLNKGDYHIHPQGSMTLKNLANGLVDQQRLEGLNIFPDSLRTYAHELGSKWMFGKYTVEIIASYGTTGQVITRNIDVWVFPWKVALAVTLALLILILLGRHMYKRLIVRGNTLEAELTKEHEELQKLKEELGRK